MALVSQFLDGTGLVSAISRGYNDQMQMQQLMRQLARMDYELGFNKEYDRLRFDRLWLANDLARQRGYTGGGGTVPGTTIGTPPADQQDRNGAVFRGPVVKTAPGPTPSKTTQDRLLTDGLMDPQPNQIVPNITPASGRLDPIQPIASPDADPRANPPTFGLGTFEHDAFAAENIGAPPAQQAAQQSTPQAAPQMRQAMLPADNADRLRMATGMTQQELERQQLMQRNTVLPAATRESTPGFLDGTSLERVFPAFGDGIIQQGQPTVTRGSAPGFLDGTSLERVFPAFGDGIIQQGRGAAPSPQLRQAMLPADNADRLRMATGMTQQELERQQLMQRNTVLPAATRESTPGFLDGTSLERVFPAFGDGIIQQGQPTVTRGSAPGFLDGTSLERVFPAFGDGIIQQGQPTVGDALRELNPFSVSQAGASEMPPELLRPVSLTGSNMSQSADAPRGLAALDPSGRLDAVKAQADRNIPIPQRLAGTEPQVQSLYSDIASQFGGIDVASGFRSPEQNARAGGAADSQHLHKKAMDLRTAGMSVGERRALLSRLYDDPRVGGIGLYPSGNIHVDTRPRGKDGPVLWGAGGNYSADPAELTQIARLSADERRNAYGGQMQVSQAQAQAGEQLIRRESAVRSINSIQQESLQLRGKVQNAPDAVAMSKHIIGRFESFREQPYYDVTAFRGGYGSDTYTTADGRVVPVTKDSRVSRADAERDLQRRVDTEFMPRAAKAAGGAWATLSPLQKGALTSMTYRYGSLPTNVANALQSGGVEAAARIMETMDKAGGGDRNRLEAALLRGNTNVTAGGKALFADADDMQFDGGAGASFAGDGGVQGEGGDNAMDAELAAAYDGQSQGSSMGEGLSRRAFTPVESNDEGSFQVVDDSPDPQSFTVPVSGAMAAAMARILNVPIEELTA